VRLPLLLAGAALTVTSALAIAQQGPESLLPPGFDNPAPAPTPAPAPAQPRPAPASSPQGGPRTVSVPVVQALPGEPEQASNAAASSGGGSSGGDTTFSRIPSIDELAKMTPEDFEAILHSKQAFAIPKGAHRSMANAGLISQDEGGLPTGSFATQNPALVRLALASDSGSLISRWGHILLRRALATRLPAPRDMTPQEFLALRVGLLVRMGETDAARAVLQDVDPGDYSPDDASTALDVYAGTGDFTGFCPTLMSQPNAGDDGRWTSVKAICTAFRGNSNVALSQLDRELSRGTMPRSDVLLAQKYAGAAGKAQRAVTIEWKDVQELTPWRYGLALATGAIPPDRLLQKAGANITSMTALAPSAPLPDRAAAADLAGGRGVLSSAAMVDLYSQIYADQEVNGAAADRAGTLRDAYVAQTPAARLAAMESLWQRDQGPRRDYGRLVLTAYAAARLTPSQDLADSAEPLIASMLTAGLDANAMRWASFVPAGSGGWALLALGSPRDSGVDTGAVDKFVKDDSSAEKRKAAFLVAGLAGLGRIDSSAASRYSKDMDLGLGSATRWTEAIDGAAAHGDPVTVAILAGFGMQGRAWSQMTPRFLYHIVSSLRRVGLEPEARMIAAEAVARA